MELNRDQIIKALECCIINTNCTDCPLWESNYRHEDCLEQACKKALALIKELTEENERSRAAIRQKCCQMDCDQAEIKALSKHVEVLATTIEKQELELHNIKSDTVRKIKTQVHNKAVYPSTKGGCRIHQFEGF